MSRGGTPLTAQKPGGEPDVPGDGRAEAGQDQHGNLEQARWAVVESVQEHERAVGQSQRDGVDEQAAELVEDAFRISQQPVDERDLILEVVS